MDLQSRVHGNSRGAAARLMRISCGATHEKEEWRNRDHQLPASRFPQKLYTRTPWGSSHVVCALARSGARCKQNAGQADRAWGGARKCSDAERNATSVFLAAGQQFLAGIDRLIAREHLHSRPKLRNLAHADAALRGNERTHLVLQSGDSREDFWRDFCGTESCPRSGDYAG